MTWQAALTALQGHPCIGRLSWLCSEDNPEAQSRDGYRGWVIRQALGLPEPDPVPPDPAETVVTVSQPQPEPDCGCHGNPYAHLI